MIRDNYLIAEKKCGAFSERVVIDRDGIVSDFDSADITISGLEEYTSVGEGVEMAEADVRGGAMTAESVEVSTTDQYHLRHAECGGAPG